MRNTRELAAVHDSVIAMHRDGRGFAVADDATVRANRRGVSLAEPKE